MQNFLNLLWGTVQLRPYVFLFLAAYLALASRHLGWRRTLVFLLGGYLLAWTSELSSIHTGFPYGLYIYIPATQDQELWIKGVPFMDSLSYVFLSYSSYSLATLWLAAYQTMGKTRRGRPFSKICLAATLFVLLDVIIDPLALRGYRWFLGQIYGYPHYGWYFGIPLSNFAGWFVVGLGMMTLLHLLARPLESRTGKSSGQKAWTDPAYRGAGLYFGVLLFNLIMTWVIGEVVLGLIAVGVAIMALSLTVAAAQALPGPAKTQGQEVGCPETG